MIPFFSPIKHPKTFDFVCFQGEEKCPYHIETIPLICSANQWISFYMIGTSVTKELSKIKVIKWIKVFTWYFRITTTTTINFFFFFFFLYGFSFRNIHESQDCRGRGEGIYLSPHYHFHPFHGHSDISRVINAESSPLNIARSWARTGNLWFPSASREPLSYTPYQSKTILLGLWRPCKTRKSIKSKLFISK